MEEVIIKEEQYSDVEDEEEYFVADPIKVEHSLDDFQLKSSSGSERSSTKAELSVTGQNLVFPIEEEKMEEDELSETKDIADGFLAIKKTVLCFAPGCTHRSDYDDCTMHPFPKSPSRRRKWRKILRLAGRIPGKTARLCSCHFINGSTDPTPNKFPYNTNKCTMFPSSEKKRDHARVGGETKTEEADVRECNSEMDQEDRTESINAQPATNVSASDCMRFNPELRHETLVHVAVISRGFVEETELRNKIKELESQVKELKEKNTARVIAEAECTLAVSRADKLQAELAALKSPKGRPVFLFSWISHKDNLVSHFTGLPNAKTFDTILRMFDGFELSYIKGWRVTRLSLKEQLFLTLVKLRRGSSHEDLAVRFGVEASTISNVFMTVLFALHKLLAGNLTKFDPARLKNVEYLPDASKKQCSDTRIILDCTEVEGKNQALMTNQYQVNSTYKQRITLKGLVGIAPNGAVIYASKLYPGRPSDKEVITNCKVLDFCEQGDKVMANKHFLVLPLSPAMTLISPSTSKISPEQVAENASIARAKSRVERAILRIKLFQILNFIPQFLMNHSSEVFQVCAALTNFRKPLLEDAFDKDEEL